MNTGQTVEVFHPLLERLSSSAIAERAFVAGTDETLFRLLSDAEDVRNLRTGLGTGEVHEKQIREFTNVLLRDFRPGVLFEHDIVLAALAVVLSRDWNTPFAEEYIIDLAKLKNPELRRSTAVAKRAAKRLYEATDTISRSFRSVRNVDAADSWKLIQPGREESSDQLEEFIL